MGLSVSFYNCTSDINVVDKTKTLIGTYDCNVYADENVPNPLEIENPVFLLPDSDSLLNCNCAYIPTFSRYYTCRVETLPDGRRIIRCQSDVLSSFFDSAKGSTYVIANRSTNHYNKEIADKLILTEKSMNVEEIALSGSSPFSTNTDYCVVFTLQGQE